MTQRERTRACGRRLDDWQSGSARQRERESERACEENWRRQAGPTGQRAREGEGAREGELPLTGGGGRRARGTGSGELVWAEMAFSFSLDFLFPFLFLFL
jgi:hypothetical protein